MLGGRRWRPCERGPGAHPRGAPRGESRNGQLGSLVRPAGDWNGDGFPDLLLGADGVPGTTDPRVCVQLGGNP